MHRFLMPVVYALLPALLAACEAISAGGRVDTAIAEAPRRCTHCGWIDAKRELPPPAGEPDVPVVYEYTVRMADGSLSVFRQEHAFPWRVGESLIVIGAP